MRNHQTDCAGGKPVNRCQYPPLIPPPFLATGLKTESDHTVEDWDEQLLRGMDRCRHRVGMALNGAMAPDVQDWDEKHVQELAAPAVICMAQSSPQTVMLKNI